MEKKDFFKFDLRKKIAFTISIFVLFIFSIIYFIVVPSVKEIKAIKKDIEEQRIDLERKYLKGQNLKKLSEKLKKVEDQIEILDNIFVDKSQDLEFVTTIEETAGRNSVLQKINLLPFQADEEGAFRVVPIQLFTQGSFINQLNYLIGIETLSYYLNVKTLELRFGSSQMFSREQNIQPGGADMMITADTYWK